MNYKIVPFNSKKLEGVAFAIDEDDYHTYVELMPSWFLAGAKNNYATCDWLGCPGGRRKIRLHRFLMLGINDDPLVVVDHINGDTLDNRRCNLRVISKAQNVSHRANLNSNNNSGTRGVYWCKTNNRWIASIMHEERDWWKQSFTDKEEAIKAIEEKRKTYNAMCGISEKNIPRLDELIEPNKIMKSLYENSSYTHNKPIPQARENYNQKRRDLTSSARDRRKEYLLSQPQTQEIVEELRRIEGDERRSQARLSGKKMTLEEKRANINEGRRLKAAAERKAKREKLLAILEKDPDDEKAKTDLKKVESSEKLAQSKMALALKKQACE